jgi:hypothetical protein
VTARAGPDRAARLRRIALTLTLLGLIASVPVTLSALVGDAPEAPSGLAVLAAAAYAAASILFLAGGRSAGLVVALPAITIGALLDDPETMGLALLLAAPAAEVAAVVGTSGYPTPQREAWERSFAEIRGATARALASTPLRPSQDGRWVLDRLTVASAVLAVVAIVAWGLLVLARGGGDDPTTRTVIPSATEFPWVLGVGLAAAACSSVLAVLTGRVPGALMALPLVPAVWLDAPQRSEVVVVVLACACGLAALLSSRVPGSTPRLP